MEDTIIIEVTDASKPNHKVPLRPIDVLKIELDQMEDSVIIEVPVGPNHKVPLRPIDVLKIELDKLNLEVNSMKNEIKMLKVKVKSEKDLYTEKGWFF